MKYLNVIFILFFICSCKHSLSKVDETVILSELKKLPEYANLGNIKAEDKLEGAVFEVQKFSIPVEFNKSCNVNINKNFLVSWINISDKLINPSEGSDARLMFGEYSKSQSITLNGYFFSGVSKEFNFSEKYNRCLFYSKEVCDENIIPEQNICDGINNFEKLGLDYLQLVSPEDYKKLQNKITLADRIGLRYLGAQLRKIGADRDLVDRKASNEALALLYLNNAQILFYGIVPDRAICK